MASTRKKSKGRRPPKKIKLPIWLTQTDEQLAEIKQTPRRWGRRTPYERRMISARLAHPDASEAQWRGKPEEGEVPLSVIRDLTRAIQLKKEGRDPKERRKIRDRIVQLVPGLRTERDIDDYPPTGEKRLIRNKRDIANFTRIAGLDAHEVYTSIVSP